MAEALVEEGYMLLISYREYSDEGEEDMAWLAELPYGDWLYILLVSYP